MTRTTRTEARKELYGVLANGLITLDHVDVMRWLRPERTGRYVAIENPGMRTDEEYWVWPVRAYMQGSEPTMEEAQQQFDDLVDAVENALRHYIVEQSPDAYSAEKDLYMAEFFVFVPRQDF